MKKYLPWLVFIMAFTFFLVGQIISDRISFKLTDEKIAFYNEFFKNLEVVTIDNKVIKFQDVEKNSKFIIVNFWATWCGPCLSEFPSFIDLKERVGKEQVEILAININQDESLSKIKKIVKKLKVNFPVILDKKWGISAQLRVKTIPFTLIFKEGQLVDVVSGPKKYNTDKTIAFFAERN